MRISPITTAVAAAALATCGTLALATAPAAAQPQTLSCWMTVGTAITSQPDPNSQILGWASAQDMIRWYGYSNGYTNGQDTANGVTGWIPSDDMFCVVG